MGIGGLFYIKSRRSGLYVGVDPSNTTSVKQYSTQNSYTRWRLKKTSSGNFALYCYATESSGLVLSTPSNTSGNGADLTMLAYVDDTNYRDEWNVYSINYTATVKNYYDSGYFIRYSESEATSRSSINSYTSTVSQVYLKTLGLLINSNTPQYYNSPVDQCKGTVTSTNIDTLCSHSGIIHTDRSNVISSFNSSCTGNNITTNILWTCHKIKSIASNEHVNYNRSCSSGYCVYVLEISSANDSVVHSQGVLLHELNHQYGARDHYHEEDANGNCKFSDICSQCGENPRPGSCIMANSRQDINSSQIICSGCKQDIINHLKDHHSN